ncbi:hypothetical protein SAY86_030694 [Trapa natans]|uniref:ER membrane protein complex subunit 1 n=1 Tax=Trapa natans TaxID=22666 RepID=A0AAN7MSP4_TRANT|nr:hypothetical protein SAY86_030694 [Trapa natans]
MAARVLSFYLLLFLSIAQLGVSLYEDQVGLMDWHQRYIGKVKHAVFHTQRSGRKRVMVSTEQNVIASLDLRHGDIFWRRVLGANDSVDGIELALGKYVISLSSAGGTLRAWNLPDGQMVWETSLQGSKPSKAFLLVPTNLKVDKDNLVLAFGGGCLVAVSSIDGEMLWKKDFAAESLEVQQVVQSPGSDVIYVLGFVGSTQFDIYQINGKNGEVIHHETSNYAGGFSRNTLIVSDDMLVALDVTGSILITVNFQGGKVRIDVKPISDLVGYYSGQVELLALRLGRMFALKAHQHIALISVTNEGKLEVAEKVNSAAAISDALPFSEGQLAVARVHHEDNKVQLTVKLGNDWSTNLLDETVKIDGQRGLVQKVFINNYIRTDRSHGFRALVVMEDHSLLLVQQGEIVWTREDGLASVLDVTTTELPVEKDGVSVSKVEQNLFDWLKGHVLKLKGTLMLATPDDMVAIQAMRLKSSEKSKMTRDHNGFRKLLIVLTQARKLYALHTGDGRIIWSLLIGSLRKSDACGHPVGLRVYPWQVPHHHAMDENPSVLVVGRCQLSQDAPGILSFVDAYTGSEIESSGPVHDVLQVIPLPFTDSTEQRLHLLIDTKQRGHLYPRSREALGIFQQKSSNIYWYSIETGNGIIRGYAIKGSCIHEDSDDFCFEPRDLWSVVFPGESEKIISTATPKLNEVVHTQAKVMAEQDLMYKYISKNLLFVATASPKASHGIGSATPEEASLVVYLIDTVTGRVFYRMTHQGCQAPVHAVFSENWVIYHYFNLRAHRYEMSVIEIYDQSRADNKDVLKLVVGKHNLTVPTSSYSRPEIVAKSQSYFFTHSVKAITVTLTAKGITSKQLLIGTIGDQVLALDKRYLDPRRSLNPSQAEKEEGVIPLTDSLPVIPQSYLTHALKVEGLRDVITVPAKLESTTLVFAYGVDLFFTRLAPSRTYDSLTEDFSYALLLLTIVALVAAIVVTWIWSERKELQEKWR